jgi:hypothetical protein
VSHYHNTTGFGSPLAALPAPAIPPLTANAAAAPTATLLASPAAVPATDRPVAGFPGADLANEMAQRYGLDPAILAAQAAATPGLRPGLLEQLGADANDPRSVADASARYLAAATKELGGVVSGLGALQAGPGPASRSELSLPVQQWIDRVVTKADQLRQPAAAPKPLTLPAPEKAVIHLP